MHPFLQRQLISHASILTEKADTLHCLHCEKGSVHNSRHFYYNYCIQMFRLDTGVDVHVNIFIIDSKHCEIIGTVSFE